ncbi:slingshot [Carabus blaptoides fortunei]
MLYVLPPPRAPNPPSPWESILCAGGGPTSSVVVKQTTKRPPPRASTKLQNLKLRLRVEESSCAAPTDDDETARTNKSLSECYFAGKGTALVLPPHERLRPSRRSSAAGSDIQQHLQSMFYLLRQEETLKMAVKLESVHAGRTRYLVVVSCLGRQCAEECCLLGIDCNERTTVGLVLRVLADTTITLDGDGGFSVSVCGRHHIFKPVSVQAMWSALQTLHKVSSKAREQNYFQGGPTHDWVHYYEQHIESDRSCLNEWHAMDSLESRRPPSPDSVRNKPRERDETERVIRATLKEIMMSVDLDEVTSKYIRSRLEEDLDMDLGEFKSFIDQEMLTILGQMDAPTEIFEHVYLGSEWNASNFEELQKNGVGHILNVTREIDNFFPGMFDYLNVRVYDDEKTDLLKYWDNTFKYITKAKNQGSKVLVHCKMGVSRSASVVIAYAMKAYNWDFQKALEHVKTKRNCIKPNTSFIAQLETYQGILDAMKNKEKLQRSKSETNLKSPEMVSSSEARVMSHTEPNSAEQSQERDQVLQTTLSGHDLRIMGARPKSWSPDNLQERNLLLERTTGPMFLSLENLNNSSQDSLASATVNAHTSPTVRRKSNSCPSENARNVLMPLNNGQSYSVSPNQIMQICKKRSESLKPSVKHRISELESQSTGSVTKKLTKDKKSLVLNLTTQFEKTTAPSDMETETLCKGDDETSSEELVNLAPPMLTAKLVKKEIWDPGETKPTVVVSVVWTSSAVLKQSTTTGSTSDVVAPPATAAEVFQSKSVLGVLSTNKVLPQAGRKDGDPFSNQVDKVFDREERKQQRNSVVIPATTATVNAQPAAAVPLVLTDVTNEDIVRECPSRQSSWSSYDSAVVLGYQGEPREAPSRHSSWGSGDTRTLPSRNSSWGSYDMRNAHAEKNSQHMELFENTSSGMFPYDRNEIPWYPGTVRRTKQRLEANRDAEKRAVEFSDAMSSTNIDGQPHKSPSTETLTSDYSMSILSENEGPIEAYNAGLLHYRSSPELCEKKDKPFVSTKAVSKEIDIVSDGDLYRGSNNSTLATSRLSVSAPESSSMPLIPTKCAPHVSCSANNVSTVDRSPNTSSNVICTAQCSSVKKHKNYLENLHKETEFVSKRNSNSTAASGEPENGSFMAGIVKNLKKEFEAKTSSKAEHPSSTIVEGDCDFRNKSKGSNSLPSSPTNNTFEEAVEDISVKELVGKYEVVGNNRSQDARTRTSVFENKLFANNQTKNMRYSCIEVLTDAADKMTAPMLISSGIFHNAEPEIQASAVVATVMKAASKKQKHNKMEPPHSCLSMKTRNNNPVYNTM